MSKRDKENAARTNDARADRVMQVLWMYADGTGQRVNGKYTAELATVVKDALSDLLHYCDREELDFSEIEESAYTRYSEELKQKPRHSRNPKTTIQPEQLPTSGRQGTTATPANRFAICAGWDFERIDTKRKLLKGLALSLNFATSGWADIPEDVRQRLLNVPQPKRLHTLYADLFESILTDSDNPSCQALWQELKRRGWEIDGITAHSATPITDATRKTSQTYCPRCRDWFEPAIRPEPDQIISDRTAQHYADPAKE